MRTRTETLSCVREQSHSKYCYAEEKKRYQLNLHKNEWTNLTMVTTIWISIDVLSTFIILTETENLIEQQWGENWKIAVENERQEREREKQLKCSSFIFEF